MLQAQEPLVRLNDFKGLFRPKQFQDSMKNVRNRSMAAGEPNANIKTTK